MGVYCDKIEDKSSSTVSTTPSPHVHTTPQATSAVATSSLGSLANCQNGGKSEETDWMTVAIGLAVGLVAACVIIIGLVAYIIIHRRKGYTGMWC